MRSRTGGNFLALAGWLLLAAVVVSFLNHPEGCPATGMWAGWWILAVPVFGIGAAVVGREKMPVVLGVSLLSVWGAVALIWLLMAIIAGACQGG